MKLAIAFTFLIVSTALCSHADPAVVPEKYAALYSQLNSKLDHFEALLGPARKPRPSTTVFSAELLTANANGGPRLLEPFACLI